MGATIQQVPAEMGKMTVDIASKLLEGEEIEYNNSINHEIYAPVKLITASEVDALLNKWCFENATIRFSSHLSEFMNV